MRGQGLVTSREELRGAARWGLPSDSSDGLRPTKGAPLDRGWRRRIWKINPASQRKSMRYHSERLCGLCTTKCCAFRNRGTTRILSLVELSPGLSCSDPTQHLKLWSLKVDFESLFRRISVRVPLVDPVPYRLLAFSRPISFGFRFCSDVRPVPVVCCGLLLHTCVLRKAFVQSRSVPNTVRTSPKSGKRHTFPLFFSSLSTMRSFRRVRFVLFPPSATGSATISAQEAARKLTMLFLLHGPGHRHLRPPNVQDPLGLPAREVRHPVHPGSELHPVHPNMLRKPSQTHLP